MYFIHQVIRGFPSMYFYSVSHAVIIIITSFRRANGILAIFSWLFLLLKHFPLQIEKWDDQRADGTFPGKI